MPERNHIELPYRWGKVYAFGAIALGVFNFYQGIIGLIGTRHSVFLVFMGVFNVCQGIGLWKKTRWGLRLFYVSAGSALLLGALFLFGSFLPVVPSGLSHVVAGRSMMRVFFLLVTIASVLGLWYFYQRSDQFK